MAAQLRIADGTPVWLSQSIVPSKDMVVSPGSSPTLAVVQASSQDVFVYVKVENTGTVDFGACACANTGAWGTQSFFTGFLANPALTTTQTQFGTTFTASDTGDSLSGPGINVSFGFVATGRRAWAWSPDGRFFAYAASPTGSDWALTVVALQALTRSDGTAVAKGSTPIAGVNGLFSGPWNQSQFGWAASQAVVVSGHSAAVGLIALVIACPYAPAAGNTYGTSLIDSAGQIDYAYLLSPCGSAISVTPKILDPVVGPRNADLVSTATAMVIPFKKNNAPTTVAITGANPSITTNSHTANGVHVTTGTAPGVDVDDPDCTGVGGGALVKVDRVKASTLPSANLGVLSVGVSAASAIAQGQSLWVQVPNTNPAGWGNQGETHWCLLAQAYTSDPSVIPPPWDGVSAFPVASVNCAQRNIQIV